MGEVRSGRSLETALKRRVAVGGPTSTPPLRSSRPLWPVRHDKYHVNSRYGVGRLDRSRRRFRYLAAARPWWDRTMFGPFLLLGPIQSDPSCVGGPAGFFSGTGTEYTRVPSGLILLIWSRGGAVVQLLCVIDLWRLMPVGIMCGGDGRDDITMRRMGG